jgi:hypothetical protein
VYLTQQEQDITGKTHALRNELEEILSHVLEVEGMQNLMQ